MKIFSLQSKISLVLWSVILGFLLGLAMLPLSIKPDGQIASDCNNLVILSKTATSTTGSITDCLPASSFGWPIAASQTNGIYFLILDFIFWILAVFISLSLIRYFKIKKQNV